MVIRELGRALVQLLLGACATCGFAMWFNVPRRLLGRTCLVGAGAFLVRYGLQRLGESQAGASFWAAVFVGLAGYAHVKNRRLPRVILTVPGIIPLIPGVPAYDAIVSFFAGDTLQGVQNGVKATLVIAALAGGLTAARAVTLSSRRAN